VAIIMSGSWFARYYTPHGNHSVLEAINQTKNELAAWDGRDHAHKVDLASKLGRLKAVRLADEQRHQHMRKSEVLKEIMHEDGLPGFKRLGELIAAAGPTRDKSDCHFRKKLLNMMKTGIKWLSCTAK
jgi:hypothetical protein